MAGLLILGSFDTVAAQSLTVSSSSLAFTAAQGGNPSPPTQTVTTGSSGAPVKFTLTSTVTTSIQWLAPAVSAGVIGSTSGNSGDTIIVQVNSSALPTGNYTGTITLTPSTGMPVTISVSLSVTGSGPATSVLSGSLSQLYFGLELGKPAPPAQTIQILSSGVSLPISSVSATTAPAPTCPSGWLQTTSGGTTTPAPLTVSILPTGLGAGLCTGTITITSNTTGNGTTTAVIPVTLFVSSGALLNVSVPTGSTQVTIQAGAAPAQFNVQLTSTDPSVPLPFSAVVTSGSQWLAVAIPSCCVTPSTLIVQVTPGNGKTLVPGVYSGSIQITSTAIFGNTLTIPVTFTLTSSSSVIVSPAGTQNFTESQGGSLPAPLTLTLTGTTNTTFTTAVTPQTGGLWLQATSMGSLTSTTPGSLTLSVLSNNLAQGVYASQVTITFQNSTIPSITIPVSLTVTAPSSGIAANPSTVSFNYQAGGSAPPAQSVTISNPAGSQVPFTVSSISDNWISVTPTSGTTPGNVSVSVSPQNLQPGSFTGSFTLTSPGLSPVTVGVSLFIGASSTPQPFIIGNAASGVGGQLAPGEIISIKGSGLGPATPASFTVGSLSSPTLGGVQVTFDGYSGTLLYVSATQINVIVPYEIAGRAATTVIVSYQGGSSTGIVQPVGTASIGLFTNNSTGSGQASILNQNYSYNTASTPALEGSYISVYATGGGQTTPASADGEVSPSATLLPLALGQFVSATIGGKPAPVLFAGAAPGYVTGVVQFNIQVPVGVSGSALPLLITIGGASTVQSQTTATVAVQ